MRGQMGQGPTIIRGMPGNITQIHIGNMGNMQNMQNIRIIPNIANIANMANMANIANRSTSVHIQDGKKIETIVEVVNGQRRQRTIITQL